MPLDARIAIVTNREKTFRLSVFWIKVQKKVKDYKYLKKMNFPNYFMAFSDCGVRKTGKVFRQK